MAKMAAGQIGLKLLILHLGFMQGLTTMRENTSAMKKRTMFTLLSRLEVVVLPLLLEYGLVAGAGRDHVCLPPPPPTADTERMLTVTVVDLCRA